MNGKQHPEKKVAQSRPRLAVRPQTWARSNAGGGRRRPHKIEKRFEITGRQEKRGTMNTDVQVYNDTKQGPIKLQGTVTRYTKGGTLKNPDRGEP